MRHNGRIDIFAVKVDLSHPRRLAKATVPAGFQTIVPEADRLARPIGMNRSKVSVHRRLVRPNLNDEMQGAISTGVDSEFDRLRLRLSQGHVRLWVTLPMMLVDVPSVPALASISVPISEQSVLSIAKTA